MRKTGIISAMWVEAEKLHMAMEQDTVKEYEYNGMSSTKAGFADATWCFPSAE